MDDLDRVFQRLVQNLKSRPAGDLAAPFTVADLYEQLIPYRHNRRELGIETNQDYEIALTRLLSGERGYLVGDEKMQTALRSEVESSNPDTAAFREFATTQVSLAHTTLQQAAARPTPAASRPTRTPTKPPARPPSRKTPAAGTPTAPVAAAPVATPKSVPAPPPPPPAPAAPKTPKPPVARQEHHAPIGNLRPPAGCRYCSGTLPEGKSVTFCPHCGQNLAIRLCPACGAEIEKGWKFCIGCGRPTD